MLRFDRRSGVALAVVAVLAGFAASALAAGPSPADGTTSTATTPLPPTPDVLSTCQGAAPGACDTEFTPVAKQDGSGQWRQESGAVFPGASSPNYQPSSSFAPDTVDFYSVSFENDSNGFAVGAACQEPNTPQSALVSCVRVPVIYQYTVGADGLGSWAQVYEGTTPGFVGAVAWIGSSGQALAVGGNGCFPLHEQPASALDGSPGPSCPNGSTPAGGDPAGTRGRVWLFDGSAWQELSRLPSGMGPLRARLLTPR
jgi:hypothetical protein